MPPPVPAGAPPAAPPPAPAALSVPQLAAAAAARAPDVARRAAVARRPNHRPILASSRDVPDANGRWSRWKGRGGRGRNERGPRGHRDRREDPWFPKACPSVSMGPLVTTLDKSSNPDGCASSRKESRDYEGCIAVAETCARARATPGCGLARGRGPWRRQRVLDAPGPAHPAAHHVDRRGEADAELRQQDRPAPDRRQLRVHGRQAGDPRAGHPRPGHRPAQPGVRRHERQPGAVRDAAPSPTGACPAGTHREFPPVFDVHVGLLSSSLGSFGADGCPDTTNAVCPDMATSTSNNDHGHLVTRKDPCAAGDVPTYQSEGFLAWDPQKKPQPERRDPARRRQHARHPGRGPRRAVDRRRAGRLRLRVAERGLVPLPRRPVALPVHHPHRADRAVDRHRQRPPHAARRLPPVGLAARDHRRDGRDGHVPQGVELLPPLRAGA